MPPPAYKSSTARGMRIASISPVDPVCIVLYKTKQPYRCNTNQPTHLLVPMLLLPPPPPPPPLLVSYRTKLFFELTQARAVLTCGPGPPYPREYIHMLPKSRYPSHPSRPIYNSQKQKLPKETQHYNQVPQLLPRLPTINIICIPSISLGPFPPRAPPLPPPPAVQQPAKLCSSLSYPSTCACPTPSHALSHPGPGQ